MSEDAQHAGEQSNPFSPEEAPGVQLIVQMRIYDVLLGILTTLDKGMAESVITAHAEGKILAPLPALDLGGNDAEEVNPETPAP